MADKNYVFIPRVRCPRCQSPSVQAYRSMARELDGSRTRYTKCRACGWKFFVIEEDESSESSTVWKFTHTPNLK